MEKTGNNKSENNRVYVFIRKNGVYLGIMTLLAAIGVAAVIALAPGGAKAPGNEAKTTPDSGSPVSRAMFVTILAKIDNADLSGYYRLSFKDVKTGKWYSRAVEWAYVNKYAYGLGDGNFGVNDPVTREQLAVFFYTYSQAKGYKTDRMAKLTPYKDASMVSRWAEHGVRWAIYSNLISGTTVTTITPQGYATRAQIAVIVMNYMENVKN